jgi:hypothetical protein
MGISARLRDFSVQALLALCLLVSTLHARAGELALERHYSTLRSLSPQIQTAAKVASAPVEPICDVFANGYDTVGATPCAGCFDTVPNFTETDVDCGGGNCVACADGKHCAVGNDCSSTVCNASTAVCAPASCANNMQDGTETAVDCGGGVCNACAVGLGCNANTDCVSNACDAISKTCAASQCSDNHKDGVETDVDCGGNNACSRCAVGKMCFVGGDCGAGHICNGAQVCQ